MISRKTYLLTHVARSCVAAALGVYLFTVAPTSAGSNKKQSPVMNVEPDVTFMEAPTFGDIIGLQPGFDVLTKGKFNAISPSAGLAELPKIKPVRLHSAALSVAPQSSSKPPSPQFMRNIPGIGLPEITVSADPRPRSLLSKAEEKALAEAWQRREEERLEQLVDAPLLDEAALAATNQDVTKEPESKQSASQQAATLQSKGKEEYSSTSQSPAGQKDMLDVKLMPFKPEHFEIDTDVAASLAEAFPNQTLKDDLTPVSIVARGVDTIRAPAELAELSFFPKAYPVQVTARGVDVLRRRADLVTLPKHAPVAPIQVTARGVDILRSPALLIQPVEETPYEQSAYILASDLSEADQEGAIEQIVVEPINSEKAETADITLALRAIDVSVSAPEPEPEPESEPSAKQMAKAEKQGAAPQIGYDQDVVQTPGLTQAQSLAVLDMVGLPGEARVLTEAGEDRATLVASVKTTSTTYDPQPVGLGGLETLRDAVEHAIATNPDIKIAEAQQEDAYFAVKEARAGFLPKVDLNAGAGPEISRQSGQDEITRVRREVNATLRQTVFDFGLTQYDYRRAKQGYESAKLETLLSVEGLTYQVAQAYLGVLQQQKIVALSQQNLEAHRNILRLVEAQKEVGQGTAADVNRVSSSLSNAESFMLEEESKLQQSRDQYRRLLDVPPGLLVDPVFDLSLLPQSAEDAAARIETESPRLLQVEADAKSIENQMRSHRGNYLPKVEVEVQGNIRTDVAGETGETRDARAMMFLRYNLFNGGADSAISGRLRARMKEIGYAFEKERREVEQSIRNDFTAIDASRAKVETIKDQVKSAQEVVRLYEEQFRAGDRTAFDLLDAQQALISAKLEQVLNSYQETNAALRVLQQLGSLYYALTSGD